MNMKFRLFTAVLVTILASFSANAQMRAGTPSARISWAPIRLAPRAGAVSTGIHATGFTFNRPASPPVSVIRISPRGRIDAGAFSAADSFQFSQEDGVPGLGFDYSFLAAVSPALHNPNNGSFGFRHHHEAGAGGGFFPIWFGGYPFYYEEYGYEQPAQPPQQQPQVIVIQQPVPAQQGAESEGGAGNDSAGAAAAPQAPAPVADVGDFILVRRDGRVLFASLYSVVGTQIQYITPEGIRRSLALSDLDAGATQQMNEARGTAVEIHN